MKGGLSIKGGTRVCGIIGNPIEHTISPAMQNAAFAKMGLDYVYLPFRVAGEGLEHAIQGMRGLNIRGFNVTIPHKVTVIQFLDEVDVLAENLGAVNTVINTDGHLKGYNTDAAGFMGSLKAARINPTGKRIVILGAGGAARAIAFILMDKGADLAIVSRNIKSANILAGRMFRMFRREVTSLELEPSNLITAMEGADVLVNTTPVGMFPDVDKTPVPARLLKKGLIVFDIIYSPLKTRLVKDAEKKGAQVIGGVEMLVRQGAIAFELWTEQKAPIVVMRNAAIRELIK